MAYRGNLLTQFILSLLFIISYLPSIRRKIPGLSVVFAGKIRAEFDSSHILNAGFIPHIDMPDAIDACDLMIAGNAGLVHSEWLASGKTLDAIMRKTPILIRRSRARIEQLGENYPMFYSEGEDIQRKIIDFFAMKSFA